MKRHLPPLAVSIGEPAGIGPDIILLATARDGAEALPPFFVIGDPGLLKARAAALDLDVSLTAHAPGEMAPAKGRSIPVLGVGAAMRARPGAPEPADAAGVIAAIEIGVARIFAGEASGIVTCPINKKALYAAGFRHPGHTEFLAELAQRHTGEAARPVMMIAGPELRTVPVTIHIPLRDVAATLTTASIVETARIVARDLERRFGIAHPRLAIAGLNPHAGEGGALGNEDGDVIVPAIRELQAEGIAATGPLPADTMFHRKARATYDAAICMYHDQALIPAKALAFETAVNVTLGLPFIRTSPDHGTAFDIAGTGKADPQSFVAALHMAWRMAEQQDAA